MREYPQDETPFGAANGFAVGPQGKLIAYRARLLGATLQYAPLDSGGARLMVSVPWRPEPTPPR